MSVLTMGESMGVIASPETFASDGAARVDHCGAESNVATGLARLGVAVTWVSRLGDDGFGVRIRRALTGEGIRVIASTDPDRPTGLLLKEQRTPAHTVVGYRRAGSAASALSAQDVEALDLDGIRLIHLTGITPALSPEACEATALLIERAHGRGALVSFDVNYRARLWSRGQATRTLGPLVASADVLFAAEDEAPLFVSAGGSATETARALTDLGPGEVVVTRGSAGAVAVRGDDEAIIRAHRITVVDTVGAGDAFVAGYLASFLDAAPLAQRLSSGSTVAAFTCMSASDWAGLPTRSELALLDSEDPVSR